MNSRKNSSTDPTGRPPPLESYPLGLQTSSQVANYIGSNRDVEEGNQGNRDVDRGNQGNLGNRNEPIH
jgi:hypothetical protein